MNNDINDKIVHAAPVPPFVTFVASAVPMVFDNSMSYYEALCALWKWLQDDVIDVINHNASVTEQYIEYDLHTRELFIELKNYVDTYFDNLDVQEEINNKLDQMAEDGTLQEIITQYIQANTAWCFDTISGLKVAENLINGSYAQTLGYHSMNDGGGALYKIRTVTNDDVVDEGSIVALADDTLVAELIFTTNINPITFGAYGDGTHDDASAIQNAIDYACAHNGVIAFNSGRYNISDSLTIPSAIKIEGTYAKGDSTTSIKGTEILITSNNKSIFKLDSGVSYYQCEFKNLRLNASDTTGCKGFDTSDATFVSECIFDTIYFNGQFDTAFDGQNTTLTTIRNCVFSSNNIAINISSRFSGNYIQNCNFWNNTQDVNATGTLENVYFDKCHFENTDNHTSMTFKAPVSLNSCAIRDCEYLANSSDYAIFFDGTNTSSFIRLSGFYIENTNIAAKTGIKIDMTGNTANNNALTDTFLNYVTFLRCTGYGVDTNYQNTRFVLINCLCFNNWYYGSGTMTNQTTPNRIRTFSFKDGLDVDTSINFKYLNSLSYSANSLYLNASNVLTWRFTDTSKTAPIAMIKLGNSADRPSSPLAGEMYYDWTVGKPIWWTGTVWIDATGTTV